ncbi:UDP-rhamnose/UDP-galactose transporter 1-like isoform X2 [Vitis riparia]|uniref:UDP-rhamnose/UDP-galactose transporter 1-like isoform X2 n=1 Tax=Vitis riparia TaxID=96939 RepID=UPI00155A7499|nr:UDP-rhamnose/UDP-galactose transporter 1-like isoform X2 [Vitis riparia]
MESDKKSSVSDVGAWAMNVISSVGIIMANKQLMSASGYAFSFATTLTGFHFAVTALVGLVSNATGYSASKYVPLWELLWFSIVANMSITGMNLSLMLNSVGFYQISKLSMIPVVCVMEWILHNKHYSREVKISVVVVVIGVGVCTVTDVKVNAKGFICACVAVVSTSLQQIFFILLSCSLAVFCNVSQYLCIGRFSAVSFQVLGHMKTVCVLTLGWLLFDSELTFKNISGMIVAVVGMIIYSWAVEIEKQANAKTMSNVKNSLTEEEIRLLKDGIEKTPVKDIELGESKE